jgi:diacylglycerol kinase (ATP)
MKPSKTIVIFNPAANKGYAERLEASLKKEMDNRDNLTWHRTKKAGESRDIAQKAVSDGYDRIIAIGGDGTTAEVINGILSSPSGKQTILGIVPVGSGNDFAGGLGIPTDPKEALWRALETKIRSVDIGTLQTDNAGIYHWINVVGIGFDAVVDIHTRSMPVFSGFWLYFFSALKTILQNHNPYQFIGKMDNHVFKRRFLMLIISNGRREGGGFRIAPRAQLDDGLLDYVGVREISRLRMLMTLPYFLKGTQERLPYVESGNLKKLEIKSDRPMQIHADGEIIAGFDSTETSLKIGVLPGAIHIAC